MSKNFLSYERALVLKELGFNEECLGYYHEELGSSDLDLVIGKTSERFYEMIRIPEHFDTLAPLHQQAFKFFREKVLDYVRVGVNDVVPGPVTLLGLVHYNKFEIHVIPHSRSYTNVHDEEIPSYITLFKFSGDAPTFEEAQEKCIDKMIEIHKNK
jgi:hypothetical protein